MPFMKGAAPVRRTIKYLQNGQLYLRDNIRIISMNYSSKLEEGEGLRRFIFWHLPQLQYKNPDVHCITLEDVTPTSFLTIYTLDQMNNTKKHHIDCFQRNRQDIHDWIKKIFCKSQSQIEQEQQQRNMEQQVNDANFGVDYQRHCICEIYGQVSCPSEKLLPEFLRGKYSYYEKDALEEIREKKSDKEAMKEYWEKSK
ncbi:hypothetical protein SNEBB_008965 [Seison nebaliae]|nr:hypothetical protein SNEBB_008965 [Seison nebaliae]